MLYLLGFASMFLLSSEAYKVLVYNPKFSHSHVNFMGRIADILVERGHEVVSLMPEFDPTIHDGTKNSTIIHIERSPSTRTLYKRFAHLLPLLFTANMFDPLWNDRTGRFSGRMFASYCRTLLDEPGLIQRLQEEHFDVMFAEHCDMCGVALVGLVKPRAFIAATSGGVNSAQQRDLGIPASLSFNPSTYLSRFNVHSLWDRMVNLHADWMGSLFFAGIRNEIDALFQEKHGADYPSIRSILSRSAYVFANQEPLIDFACPSISKVIYIPGLGAQQPSQLDSEWERVLTRRPRTVLVSFGSTLMSMHLPARVRAAIVEAVKAFPDVTFIWKYDAKDSFTMNDACQIYNLVLTRWMPQVDILNHKNLRAFITHGGMESTQETAARGVPGIFMPIFAEQPRNSAMMEYNGLGRVISKSEMTNASKVIEVVREVLENPRYYDNAQRIAVILRSKPFTSKEQLIKYTEFAAEFGPSVALSPQSHDMNWIEHNNVDLIVVGFMIAAASLLFVLKMIALVARGYSVKRKTA